MDLSQLKLNSKIDVNQKIGNWNLGTINQITGLANNSISSLQALIFPQEGYNEDINPTDETIVGITANLKEGGNKGFIFDLKEDYRLNLTSDITDHYVEENIAIQDHIALKPIILEVSGKISEKTLITPYDEEENTDSIQKTFNKVNSYYNRMGSLSTFVPNIMNQAKDILNTAQSAYNTYKSLSNFIKSSKGDDKPQTRQSKIVSMFRDYWMNRTEFTIVTPFCILDSMYILDFSANQPKNTKYVTEIRIKFKHLRKAEVKYTYTRVKCQGLAIEENKKQVTELPPEIVGQSAFPPIATEEKMAGDFVKQTLNVVKQSVITTEEKVSSIFKSLQSSPVSKITEVTNIANTDTLYNTQTLMNNTSLLPKNIQMGIGF